ncbi:TetR/AcrR family transcriptional regulator [Thalassorhabdomicrobium marinisediminis]|uniref:TetR/AcrR family transcriptional regulator n=1 Tax=Thalassorhabdomicrobium marinisediminis TaxID=2170577 RepID=A0A2T7FZ10_9RHOB|nr:TetR/AcrR family transcriptional regulator [Thalassorhabdomicrobium marinisediminis]PVA07395.1 TetR/AcrR family transcriptional regulator [Thalassorhabdomicrobium marinisediminis]
MNETEQALLEAAMRVFSRYGVKRTNMSDLCEEAGVSRQTFYNNFRNKDDILRALIRSFTARALAEIDAHRPACPTLGAQLDLVFEQTVIAGFDMVSAMPNAEDFIDGVHASSKQEVEATHAQFRRVIADILAPYAPQLGKAGVDVASLSDFVQRASKAAAIAAQDRDHLLTQLATLRQLCLAAANQLNAPEQGPSR